MEITVQDVLHDYWCRITASNHCTWCPGREIILKALLGDFQFFILGEVLCCFFKPMVWGEFWGCVTFTRHPEVHFVPSGNLGWFLVTNYIERITPPEVQVSPGFHRLISKVLSSSKRSFTIFQKNILKGHHGDLWKMEKRKWMMKELAPGWLPKIIQ